MNHLYANGFKASHEDIAQLSNESLMTRLATVVGTEREATADFLELLGEVDARRLYMHEASPSLFQWLMDRWNFSEAASFRRITVARKGRDFPALIQAIREGRMNVSGATVLAPHLTMANVDTLLQQAAGKSKRDIEMIAARLIASQESQDAKGTRKPAVKVASVRSIPAPALPVPIPVRGPNAAPLLAPTSPTTAQESPAPVIGVRIGITLPTDAYAMLDDLMKNNPGCDMADVLAQAIKLMHSRRDPGTRAQRTLERASRTDPNKLTMHRNDNTKGLEKQSEKKPCRPALPVAVRAAVWTRDHGRCSYVAPDGRRCTATHRLEFDHIQCVAHGGGSDAENLRLRCTLHNRLAAVESFGADFMSQWIEPPQSRCP